MSDSHETVDAEKSSPKRPAASTFARFVEWFNSVFFAPVVPRNGKKKWELTHNETTATIRRTFLIILAASIYCAITLAGSSDARLIHDSNIVELPVLSYKVDFHAFLLGAPCILIGLTLYLHIFIAQHRMHPPLADKVVPMLGNFNDLFPKFVAWLLYYWLTPLVLALFAWKVYPIATIKSEDQIKPHLVMTVALAISLLYLQIRRCPPKRRLLPAFLLLALFSGIAYAYCNELSNRRLELRMVDLSGANLEQMVLSNADMGGAILRSAQLERARLMGADLREADLTKANLKLAILDRAEVDRAKFICANLEHANFEETKMDNADLSYSKLEFATFISPQLNGAEFTGANLTKSKMSGKPSLTRATLTNANLRNINWKCVDLTEASFLGSVMTEARFTGKIDTDCAINFTSAKLQKAVLDNSKISGATFDTADLSEANLDGITIDGSDFNSAILKSASARSATITGSRFYYAEFDEADLAGSIIEDSELNSAYFVGADMTKTRISGDSNLKSARFSKADLTEAVWRDVNASYAYFDGATMLGIELNQSSLDGAILEEADLSHANLTEVSFLKASLKSAKLENANLSGADLSGALDLEQSQLDQACGDSTTQLPDGLSIKDCPDDWRDRVRIAIEILEQPQQQTVTENLEQTEQRTAAETENTEVTEIQNRCAALEIKTDSTGRENGAI